MTAITGPVYRGFETTIHPPTFRVKFLGSRDGKVWKAMVLFDTPSGPLVSEVQVTLPETLRYVSCLLANHFLDNAAQALVRSGYDFTDQSAGFLGKIVDTVKSVASTAANVATAPVETIANAIQQTAVQAANTAVNTAASTVSSVPGMGGASSWAKKVVEPALQGVANANNPAAVIAAVKNAVNALGTTVIPGSTLPISALSKWGSKAISNALLVGKAVGQQVVPILGQAAKVVAPVVPAAATLGGTVLGGIYGGPAGAAIGGTIGKILGNALGGAMGGAGWDQVKSELLSGVANIPGSLAGQFLNPGPGLPGHITQFLPAQGGNFGMPNLTPGASSKLIQSSIPIMMSFAQRAGYDPRVSETVLPVLAHFDQSMGAMMEEISRDPRILEDAANQLCYHEARVRGWFQGILRNPALTPSFWANVGRPAAYSGLTEKARLRQELVPLLRGVAARDPASLKTLSLLAQAANKRNAEAMKVWLEAAALESEARKAGFSVRGDTVGDGVGDGYGVPGYQPPLLPIHETRLDSQNPRKEKTMSNYNPNKVLASASFSWTPSPANILVVNNNDGFLPPVDLSGVSGFQAGDVALIPNAVNGSLSPTANQVSAEAVGFSDADPVISYTGNPINFTSKREAVAQFRGPSLNPNSFGRNWILVSGNETIIDNTGSPVVVTSLPKRVSVTVTVFERSNR